MHNSVSKLDAAPVRALGRPLSYQQETNVLDLLSDGIFVLSVETLDITTFAFNINFANKALAELVPPEAADIVGQPLGHIFPERHYRPLHDALRQVVNLETSHEFELAYKTGGNQKQLRVSLNPYFGPPMGENKVVPIDGKKIHQIIGTMTDVTDLITRANYLEDRAVKLIDHANGLETSRRELEKELQLMRRTVQSMERSAHFDLTTGLPNRSHFLERGSAEFQRSMRYGHALSIIVASVQGYEQIVEAHGEKAGNLAMTGLSQVCETAYRNGADIAGRIGDTEIAIILPETSFSGAVQFVERLRALVAATPIQAGNGFVRLGIICGVDTVQSEDRAFIQCLTRAQDAQADI